MSVRKMTVLALFTTVSLAIYGAENALPPLLPIPGVKLGLANIVTLVLLQRASIRDALRVLVARILLSALLFGNGLSLLYSIWGGLFALICMALCTRLLQRKMTFLTGAVGGLTHNMGQLLAAFFISRSFAVAAYLPFLILSGILTGLFTGLCGEFTCRHLLRGFPLFEDNSGK